MTEFARAHVLVPPNTQSAIIATKKPDAPNDRLVEVTLHPQLNCPHQQTTPEALQQIGVMDIRHGHWIEFSEEAGCDYLR